MILKIGQRWFDSLSKRVFEINSIVKICSTTNCVRAKVLSDDRSTRFIGTDMHCCFVGMRDHWLLLKNQDKS